MVWITSQVTYSTGSENYRGNFNGDRTRTFMRVNLWMLTILSTNITKQNCWSLRKHMWTHLDAYKPHKHTRGCTHTHVVCATFKFQSSAPLPRLQATQRFTNWKPLLLLPTRRHLPGQLRSQRVTPVPRGTS